MYKLLKKVLGWRFVLLRIVDENIFEIRLEQYQKNEILSFIEKEAHPEELAFMLYEKGIFSGVWSAMDIIENRVCIPLYIQRKKDVFCAISLHMEVDEQMPSYSNLFQLARCIFHKYNGKDYQYLAVMNEAGECEFLLRFEENRIYGEKADGTLYDSFWDLDTDMVIDDTLLNRYHSYVIYEYNEYTDYILRYISSHMPDKECICLDKKTGYLWELESEENHPFATNKNTKLKYVQSEWQIGETLGESGRIMFIASNHTNEYGRVANYLTGVYSSLAVVKSMVWCGKRRCFGNENVDKTILLLDCPVKGSGLVDLMKFTAIYCELARMRGLIPVVAYQDLEGYFVTNKGDDLWELFFEPVSDITVKEARRSNRVIVASENEMRLVDWEMNPYVHELDSRIWGEALWHEKENLLRRYIHPGKSILTDVKNKLPMEFCEDKKILGVIARGTDYRKESVKTRGSGDYIQNRQIEEFLPECQRIMQEKGYDYIYLATEDQYYFELFLVQFEDRLLFHEQKRAMVDTKEKETLLVSDLLKTSDPTRQNMEYCCVLAALCFCEELVSSMNCGAYLAGLSKIFLE